MTRPDPIARVALVTLGCAKNQADTDLLAGQLLQEGFSMTGEVEEADMILVNTCAFLSSSQQESIDMILEMVAMKGDRPNRRLVVLGCLAQRHGADLLKEIPEIDLLVGPGEVHSIAPRLLQLLQPQGSNGDRVQIGGMDRVEERWDLRVLSANRHSAYVKISEGCDRACAFCIIPRLRGPHRSRSRESILREVRHLADSGVREVNLVAQELTAYGVDLYGKVSLAELLADLNSVESLAWIRLLYTYPTNWSDDLVEAIRDLPRVVPYVDMPIQHVDERLLRRMRRPPFSLTRRILERFRREIPGVAVRTTLITGLPGEGESEFEQLLAFVDEYRFDALGVFAYSREEGTDAAELDGQVPEPIREERRQRLLSSQQKVSEERNREWIGRRVSLLIDTVDEKGDLLGRHAGQAPEVDGSTRLIPVRGSSFGPGEFVDATVTGSTAYDLVARHDVERTTT